MSNSTVIGAVVDVLRSKADLIAENALLRHQLTLLKRQSKRPRLKSAEFASAGEGDPDVAPGAADRPASDTTMVAS